MGQRIVKQPDGNFGVFSEVVDDFVHLNVPRVRIAEVAEPHVGPMLQKAIDSALQDIGIDGNPINADTGLGRWYEALETVKLAHGRDAMRRVLKDADSGKEMER